MTRMIKMLCEFEIDEIEGVEDYAKMAVEMLEENNKEDAQQFYEMAKCECEHAEKIHEMLVREVEKMKERTERFGIRVPKIMKDKYEKHESYIERLSIAKEYLEIYKAMAGPR